MLVEMCQFSAAACSRAAPSKARDLHAFQYHHDQGSGASRHLVGRLEPVVQLLADGADGGGHGGAGKRGDDDVTVRVGGGGVGDGRVRGVLLVKVIVGDLSHRGVVCPIRAVDDPAVPVRVGGQADGQRGSGAGDSEQVGGYSGS